MQCVEPIHFVRLFVLVSAWVEKEHGIMAFYEYTQTQVFFTCMASTFLMQLATGSIIVSKTNLLEHVNHSFSAGKYWKI